MIRERAVRPMAVVLFLAILAGVQGAACIRDFDPSKLACSRDEGCPGGYHCSNGRCAREAERPDGGADTSATLPLDMAADRATSTGGLDSGGWPTGDVASRGGAGGIQSPDGPPATGGATAVPDAPTAPDAADAPAGSPNGTACVKDAECSSARCIDGVCCASACSGCSACAKALTGRDDGICAPVASGKDPHEACADQTATQACGEDGTCDGQGACRKVGSGKGCGQASCSADGNTFTPEPRCDGNGACVPGTPQVCTPYPCTTTGCARTCASQTDCDAGTYCDIAISTCAAKKANGAAATQTYACASGFLADGVCCNSACTEACRACNLSGSTGTCTRVAGGQPAPGHGSCTNAGSTCGGSCDGTQDTCSYPGASQNCGATASCSSKVYQAPGACAGNGSCSTPAPVTCQYVCNVSQGGCTGVCNPGEWRCYSGARQECSIGGAWQANACPASQVCSGAGVCGCAAGTTTCGTACCNNTTQYCNGSVCASKHATGACSSGAECTTGYCVGGYCCSSSSCGTGQTCSSGSCACPFTIANLTDKTLLVAPAMCVPWTVAPQPPSASYDIKWFMATTEVAGNPVNPGESSLTFACACSRAGVYHYEVTLNGCTARSNDATLRMLCLDNVTYCGLAGQPMSCP